ncbi:MAG: hypothetical protein RMA76_02945 [Deltaproteobacteria bacterium]|jgi:ribosomal protein S27E
MARKRSGGGRRNPKYRPAAYRVTCKTCGIVMTVPVRPPPGVDLNCPECTAKTNAELRDEAN